MRFPSTLILSCTLAALLAPREVAAQVFENPGSVPIPGIGDFGLNCAAADFDENGRLDLVIPLTDDHQFAMVRGLGDGRFTPPRREEGGRDPLSVAAGDLNGDGHVDVVVGKSNFGGNDIRIYLGLGNGVFSYLTALEAVNDSVISPVLADFDRDGDLDLAVANSDVAVVSVFMGRGDGTFFPVVNYEVAALQRSLVTGDFDEDGNLDLLASMFGSSLTLLFGDGAGGFPGRADVSVGTLVQSDIAIADFDGDRHLDVAVPVFAGPGSELLIFLGDGQGGFEPPRRFPSLQTPLSAEVADFDEDGDIDIAVASFVEDVVSIYRGDGTGDFSIRLDIPVGMGPRFVLATDIDGDTHADLAVACANSDEISILMNRTPFRLPGVLQGNVNASAGPIANVLFVNGLKGQGRRRELIVGKDALFQIRMKVPPALGDGPAAFALFAWVGLANESTIEDLGGLYGLIAMPSARVRKRWNNTGDSRFGSPDFPSLPAPSVVLRRERGLRRTISVTLQGVIEDPESPSGEYAVTNGIGVISR